MKKTLLVPLLSVFIVSLVGCQNTNSSSFSSISSTQSSEKALDISVSFINEETINVYNEWQLKYINDDNYEDTGVACGTIDWSRPTPIKVSWSNSGADWQEITSYRLILKDGDSVFKTFDLNKDAQNCSISNLKMRTTYKCILQAFVNDIEVIKIERDLLIDQNGPRLIDVEGVDNMRDLGGYGIKQGLIYRSGRLSEEDGKDKITASGKTTMLDELNIKSEIDLRRYDENGGITASPLGSSVNYLHLPMVYGGNNIATYKGTYEGYEYDNPKQIKDFFTYLSEESHYPLVFHCSIGKDRTGCLAYLLEGLLGMEEEYLIRDYLFSNFAHIGSICKIKDVTSNNKYGQTIKDYEGETISEKVKNFLTSETIGLDSSVIEKVISILKDQNYGRE